MSEIYDGYKYTDRLLPCPFCGGENNPPFISKKKGRDGSTLYTIMCSNCGAEPNFQIETEQEAIDHWNTRFELQGTEASIVGFNIAKKRIIEMIKMLHVKKLEKDKT